MSPLMSPPINDLSPHMRGDKSAQGKCCFLCVVVFFNKISQKSQRTKQEAHRLGQYCIYSKDTCLQLTYIAKTAFSLCHNNLLKDNGNPQRPKKEIVVKGVRCSESSQPYPNLRAVTLFASMINNSSKVREILVMIIGILVFGVCCVNNDGVTIGLFIILLC